MADNAGDFPLKGFRLKNCLRPEQIYIYTD